VGVCPGWPSKAAEEEIAMAQVTLSEKQMRVLERNAPDVIVAAAQRGHIKPALLWLDAFFWELDLKRRERGK